MNRTMTNHPAGTTTAARHSVSRPHDATERQADRAADVVSRGGSVTGWSFAAVPEAAPTGHVHRQDQPGAPKTDEEKYQEAATETAKAALKTPAGQRIVDAVQNDPLVKAATKVVTSPAGIGVGLGLGAAGVGALAATGKPLPFQPPAIPLDRITPGLSAQLTYEGPVNAPTKVGLSLKFTEQGPKQRPGGPTAGERYRAETDRMAAEQAKFRAGLRTPAQVQQDKSEQDAIARYVASRSTLPGVGRPLIPLVPGAPIETATPTTDAEQEPADQEQKKPDDAPVQREPASASTTADTGLDTGRVDGAVRGGGRSLDPPVRRSMEARFGYDFSRVRIHDDAAANSAAADVRASAFTVGDDIAFASGGFDPSTAAGRHLLAHELAHVVQQGQRRERKSVDETPVHRQTRPPVGLPPVVAQPQAGAQPAVPVAPPLADTDLQQYLTDLRRRRAPEGTPGGVRKARELIGRFQAGAPAFGLLTVPDRVLLIKELLNGTTPADGAAALDLMRDALPEERVSMLWDVGESRLRTLMAISPANARIFDELITMSVNQSVEALLTDWTVEGVRRILERNGDAGVIDTVLDRGYTIKSFAEGWDRWRYPDGRVENNLVRGLHGNTDRDSRVIRLNQSLNDEEAATTLFHESRHALASNDESDRYLEDEINARVRTEEFAIRHGMAPTGPGYRRADGTVAQDVIRAEILGSAHYNPGATRTRIARWYVGERPVRGWRVRRGGHRP